MLEEADVNYKRYLQQLLLESITDVQFIHSPVRNQSKGIFSSHDQRKAAEIAFKILTMAITISSKQ